MPDVQEQQRAQQQQDPNGQNQQWPDGRSQGTFDSLFGQQIAGADPSGREAWQAYFDLAEQTLRTARRVSEVQVLSMMRQQIVQDVTQAVLAQMKSSPGIARQIADLAR